MIYNSDLISSLPFFVYIIIIMDRPVDSSYLVNLFRFEHLKNTLKTPLSSDAFSKFADGEKDDKANNKEVVEATQHLLNTVMNTLFPSFRI